MNKKMHTVYQEIGLQNLIDSICNGDTFIIHQKICDKVKTKAEIFKSQTEFSDFLNDNANLLNTLYENIASFYSISSIYNGAVNDFKKATNFILYSQKYCQIIELVINNFTKFSYQSDLIKNFYNDLLTIFNNETFKQFFLETQKASDALNKILVFQIDYSNNKINQLTETKSSIRRKMENLLDQLQIPYSAMGYVAGNFNDFLDIQKLKKVYTNEFKIIENFYKRYYKFSFYNFKNIYQNLQFYLQMKHFFISISNYNIPYFRAHINEQRIIELETMYDISLINRVEKIIPNDFKIDQNDPKIIIIAGANSGGKTSFIRAITINLLLFNAVGYVFAEYANLPIFSEIIAIFNTYSISNKAINFCKLEEELKNCDDNSIIIFNELFSELDEDKALEIFKRMFSTFYQTNKIFIMVTHCLDIINYLKEYKFLQFSPQIDKKNNYNRTYVIQKNLDNYNTFVESILQKYGLLREQLFNDLVGEKNE